MEQMVDDKTKVKSFDGVLIPKTIITDLYFANEQEEINSLELKAEALIQEIEELAEEHCVEEGLLEVFTEEGFNLNKTNVNKRIKDIKNKEAYDEEFRLLTQIKILYDDQKKIQDELKEKQSRLDEAIIKRYQSLTEEEIKEILFEHKWMLTVQERISRLLLDLQSELISRVKSIIERYEYTLGELETDVQEVEKKVKANLERMGFAW